MRTAWQRGATENCDCWDGTGYHRAHRAHKRQYDYVGKYVSNASRRTRYPNGEKAFILTSQELWKMA